MLKKSKLKTINRGLIYCQILKDYTSSIHKFGDDNRLNLLKKLHIQVNIKESSTFTPEIINSLACDPSWEVCAYDITYDY